MTMTKSRVTDVAPSRKGALAASSVEVENIKDTRTMSPQLDGRLIASKKIDVHDSYSNDGGILIASSDKIKTKAPSRLHLTTLPSEIHLQLFELLDQITSTCLGLTCKKFYAIHRVMQGKVPLWTPLSGPCAYWKPSVGLWESLGSWFPANLTYHWGLGKYVTEETITNFYKELEERRQYRDWKKRPYSKRKMWHQISTRRFRRGYLH